MFIGSLKSVDFFNSFTLLEEYFLYLSWPKVFVVVFFCHQDTTQISLVSISPPISNIVLRIVLDFFHDYI